MTDGDDHSQPPLLGEPSTSGLRLHTPPPPTDSGMAKKKLPLLKPVEIRVTPCLVKQPPSQQPLFESSTSHQSDLGSEATITYESDSVQCGAYRLRDRKNWRFPSSSSSSDSDDVYKDSTVKYPTKIRKSPRQMAARRKRVNGTREIVYKDLSSSEIESIDDTESMDTVSGCAEDTTDLSDGAKLPKPDGARRPNCVSTRRTPTKIIKSARLRRDLESDSRRISPRKRNSSSEPEGSRKLRATERELRRSDRKRDLNKTEFQMWSSHKRDSSWESDNSRKSQTTLRRSERKRDSDKAEFQTRSPHKRGSSQESEKSGSSTATAVELRRSERKRGLDRAEIGTNSRDSSQESENSRNSRAAAVKLRRKRNHGLDDNERDSSSESESTAKFKATALKLRRSERKQCSDQETSLHHKRDSSSESDSTRKSRTTASGPRRSERRRNLDKADLQTHSSHKQGNSSESETARKSKASAMTLRSSKTRQDSDKIDFQARSPHKRDSSSESESSTEEESMLRRTKRTNHTNVDLKIKSSKKTPSSASHTESKSESAHHILRQRRKDKSNEGVSLKTATLNTNATSVQGDEVGPSNNATSNFYGHRLRSHPGNSPSTSPQSSVARNSVSPMNLRGGKIREGPTQPGNLSSKQDQRKKVIQNRKTTPTTMPVEEQIQGKRRTDGDSDPTKSTNQWISPKRLEQDRRKGDIRRNKSVNETLDNNSSMRRSPRTRVSSTAQDLHVQQGHNSPLLAERKSQRLANAEDNNPSSRHHATSPSTHERGTLTTVADSAASTKVVSSGNTPQKSPVNVRRKLSAKSLSPSDSRAGLPSSLPRDFKRPKKRLNFSQNSSGADSDGGMKNPVKRVRFATGSDSEELSETDTMLLNAASESHQEKKSPKKNPVVGCSTIETSDTETSLQVASEITVSSDASSSSQSPSLLSDLPIAVGKQRRTRKGPRPSVPQTPPTQLSLRGDEGIRLPTPPLATSTILHYDNASDSDKTQSGGSSGIHTVLSQVSQLKRKRGSKQSNGQRKPRNKVKSRTAESPSLSEQRNANRATSIGHSATVEKSPQQDGGGTTRGSSRGAMGSENTRKRNRSKKMESSYKDESATMTVGLKKRRKISDTYVPPASYCHRHDKDSTTNSRSPRKRRSKGHHSSGGCRGTERSDQEENPAHYGVQGEEHSATSMSADATNVERGDREEAPANNGNQMEVLASASASGDTTSAGRSDREEAPANNGNQGEAPVPASVSGDGSREEAPANNRNQGEAPVPASASGDGNREEAPANNGNHASASVGGDGTKSNREEAPANNRNQMEVLAVASASGDAASTSTTIDSDSQGSLLCVSNLSSDRVTGNNDRAQPSVVPGEVVVQVLSALHNPGAPSMFTTGCSGGQNSVLCMGNPLIATQTRQKSPVAGLSTHSIPSYGETSKSTTLERSNRVIEQAPADEMTIQSPDIDVVGYTPEYSEPTEGESTDDGVIVMDLQDRSHTQLETAPNPSRTITHPPYTSNSGHPSANPSMSYQSTPSNTDRLVYTHPPYTSNSGRPFAVVNQSTSHKRVSTLAPYASKGGQPSTKVNQSTPFSNDRLVNAHTPCTPSNGRPRPCVNQSTPSATDRRIYTHTPYTYNIGRPRSNLSTWYHENSPGNSPEIGLMNHLPFRTETPRQQHQQSFRNTSNIKGVYSQSETDSHERLNLIDDEYEMSQVQSQYYHAPIQKVAQQMHNFSDSESIVSDSSASVLSVPR